MPYVMTPKWAKNLLSAVYTTMYAVIGLSGLVILLPPNPRVTPLFIVGIMVLSTVLAIYGVLHRSPHWEWAAIWFILGGVSAYVVIDWIDAVQELLSGGTMFTSLLLEASVASVALLLLIARTVLLTIAVRENRNLYYRKS